MAIQTTSVYTPSAFQKLYVKLDGRLQVFGQSISITRSDEGTDIGTTVIPYAGRISGNAKVTGQLKGVVPYVMKDASGGGGVGFSSAGLVTGKGFQLDQTMLVAGMNQNASIPLLFAVLVGNPAVQKCKFKGFIGSITVDYADGKQADFTAMFSGECTAFF